MNSSFKQFNKNLILDYYNNLLLDPSIEGGAITTKYRNALHVYRWRYNSIKRWNAMHGNINDILRLDIRKDWLFKYFLINVHKISEEEDGIVDWYQEVLVLYFYYSCLKKLVPDKSINSSLNKFNPKKIKIIYNGLLECLYKKELIELNKFSFCQPKIDGNLMKNLVKFNFNDCDSDYVISYKSNKVQNSKQTLKKRSLKSCKGLWVSVHCIYIFKMIDMLSMRHPHFYYLLKVSHAKALKSLFEDN